MSLLAESLPLASLWLPIAVSTVALFVLSMIVCMLLPYHRSDWKKLPDDQPILEMLRTQKPESGLYLLPSVTPAELNTPEARAHYEKGPWGVLIVPTGEPSMGRSTGLWFVMMLGISVCVGYVVSHLVGPAGDAAAVFRFATTMGFVIFAASALPGTVWDGKPARVAWKGLLDAAIYALTMGAIFRFLWPNS
jgi:hypothetical protein